MARAVCYQPSVCHAPCHLISGAEKQCAFQISVPHSLPPSLSLLPSPSSAHFTLHLLPAPPSPSRSFPTIQIPQLPSSYVAMQLPWTVSQQDQCPSPSWLSSGRFVEGTQLTTRHPLLAGDACAVETSSGNFYGALKRTWAS